MARPLLEGLLGVQFFGEFLIDRWVINREQLLCALEYQMNRNERFGAIAVRKGFLTKAQVDDLNQRQRQTDVTFGELAVSAGLLTRQQAQQIVAYQRQNNVLLGETLLRLNYIDAATLKRELTNFREHQKRFFGNEAPLPVSSASAAVIRAGLDLTRKMFRRVAGVAIKAGHATVMCAQDESSKISYPITVAIDFSGAESITFILSVSKSLAVPIAAGLLGRQDTPEDSELVLDAVKEFCNYICGNMVAKVARKGFDVDISPPIQLKQIPEARHGRQAVAFPVRSTAGGLDVRFHVPL
jgi:CheY-specific phosphatase CheX